MTAGPLARVGANDEFGIVTEAAKRRALYGRQRRPQIATEGAPALIAPPARIVVPHVVSPETVARADRLAVSANVLARRLDSMGAMVAEIEESIASAKTRREPQAARVNPSAILAAVCEAFGVTTHEMCGPARHQPIARARHAFCRLAKRHAGMSFPKIGAFLKRADHTSAVNSIKRAELLMRTNDAWRARYDAAELMIGARGGGT